jgi:hypothetical protein
MKLIKYVFLVPFLFSLVSCFEITEEIRINRNGTGSLAVKTDMGQLLEMMQSFMSAEDLEKSQFGQVKDTLIQMKDLVDTAQNITKENKALLRDGSIKMEMNAPEKIFRVNLTFPFKKLQDLPLIYQNMDQGGGGMAKLMQGLGNDNSAPAAPDMKQPGSFYDFEAGRNSFSRKINKQKYQEVMNDSMMQQLKQMGGMGSAFGEIKMTTSIALPSPAKKVTGAKAELSADKKTVLIKANMLDMFEKPEDYEFTVSW